MRRIGWMLLPALLLSIAACGEDDAPAVSGSGVEVENPDEHLQETLLDVEKTDEHPQETLLDCDATDVMFFAPALGNGQADPVSAARSTLSGNGIEFDLDDTSLDEGADGEVLAMRDGRVVAIVSTGELKDGTWGPGHAEWCTEFEPISRPSSFRDDQLDCVDVGRVVGTPQLFDQAPTPDEAVRRTFDDPEYGPGIDFTVEEWEDGMTWIVRNPSGDVVGTARPVQVEDGTWALSEWTFCPSG